MTPRAPRHALAPVSGRRPGTDTAAEAVDTARHRCLQGIAAARAALRGAAPDDTHVHRARRELKRARALLRLVRAALPADVYRGADETLRDAGRLLAGARDAAVLQALVERTAMSASVRPLAVRTFCRRLLQEWQLARDATDLAGTRALLARARSRIAAAPVEGDSALLAAGFVKIYRRGRQAFGGARRVRHPVRLHEWRKHVKHYWHALEVLEPVSPQLLGALAREARSLADALGQHHDCVLLAQRLKAAPLGAHVRRPLLRSLARRREALYRAALAAGRRLYEQKPRRLARRALEWWQGWAAVQGAERARRTTGGAGRRSAW